jgi:hypothetical protein
MDIYTLTDLSPLTGPVITHFHSKAATAGAVAAVYCSYSIYYIHLFPRTQFCHVAALGSICPNPLDMSNGLVSSDWASPSARRFARERA